MHEMEFYEHEVEAYEAFEKFAGPFDSIYYMGSGIDRTPSETLQGEVVHVDHDPNSVNYLKNQGLDAREQDVTSYRPGKNFDLILISHLTANSPLIVENMDDEGAVLCGTESRARKLDENTELDLDAVYRDEILQEDPAEVPEAQMYFFR
ncbi:hypothetical protein ACK3SF_03680 [Candidatus Nanosalina sp. VS9-1]|uniref:hypothetical protein n=1 Tax=Candidatus Nanosalina sp. VS9-1 TaxID=3388566 RepID=UPI0039DFA23B